MNGAEPSNSLRFRAIEDFFLSHPSIHDKLEITLTNPPPDTAERRAKTVRLERLFLSVDGSQLLGSISVRNICYSKQVAFRFSFDDWDTISEVAAQYDTTDPTQDPSRPYDCFTFNVALGDLIGIESKTMRCCVRYVANGQEYWDNNAGSNFNVRFGIRTDEPHSRGKSGEYLPKDSAIDASRYSEVIDGLDLPELGSKDSIFVSSTEACEIPSWIETNALKSLPLRKPGHVLSKTYDLDASLAHTIRNYRSGRDKGRDFIP